MSHIASKDVQREHRRLLRRWAVGKASKSEIMRCIELDRRVAWAERHGNDTSKLGRNAITPSGTSRRAPVR